MMFWISLALKALGFFMNAKGSSDANKKRFKKIVDSARDNGLITVVEYDTFNSQLEELKKEGDNERQD